MQVFARILSDNFFLWGGGLVAGNTNVFGAVDLLQTKMCFTVSLLLLKLGPGLFVNPF